MDFFQLMKMRYLEVSEPQDIECCGTLEYYDKVFDHITMRSEKPLQNIKFIFHKVATTDRPEAVKTMDNVIATDDILDTLMSCTYSMYSWDIDVQRFISKLFLTRGTILNFTVSGTANEPPQGPRNSFNSSGNLAMEATYIDHNFFQQCLRMGRERYNFPNPNPFVEDDMNKNEIAFIVYHYLRWKLGEDIELIFLYENNIITTGEKRQLSFINIKALNEWDCRHCNGNDWCQKLDSSFGCHRH